MRVPKRQEKSRFWERVRAGIDRTEAARRAGVSATSARQLVSSGWRSASTQRPGNVEGQVPVNP